MNVSAITQADSQVDNPEAEIFRLKHELHITLKTLRQADLFNQRLGRIVQQLDDIVLALDPDGKILFLNDYGQKWFGYQEDEILGQQVLGTLIPTTVEGSGRYLPEMLCRLLKNPDAMERNQNENLTRDGRRYLIAWKNWALQNRRGELVEIVCLGHVLEELS